MGPVSRPPTSAPWKKFMALAVVGIMVLTGFAVFGQAVVKSAPAPAADEQPESAKALAGSREMTMTIDHMFELYLKSHDPDELGRWNGTMGLNDWWGYGGVARTRWTMYQEYQARTEFPFIMNYNPYSTMTTPDIDQGGSITTWYRQTIDAKNLTAIAAGPNLDPIFTPVLGPTNTAGAYMNITWYGTYLEYTEIQALWDGTHYGNTYYGVPAGSTPRVATDDGYYHELQGKLEFNRAAANKILGLGGTGDLRTQFTANDDTITGAWYSDWLAEGSSGGAYDIYTAYDFNLAIQWLELTLDPTSTADNLVIRFWSISWGNECLLIRYMEAADAMRNWQGWPDDWYLNVSIAPDGGNIQSRGVIGYHMYATKDYMNNINGWALEASHMDWCGNAGPHQSYPSPYTAYDPKSTDVTHISTAPLTKNIGKPVSYILAPLHWNLIAGEKIIVKLPSASTVVPGYHPKASASDILGPTKLAEMEGNVSWGELVAGNGYPSSLKTTYYNKATKTYTLQGPLTVPVNTNPAFPTILNYGAPMFVMNVVNTFTMNLTTGWNFVSLPLAGYGYKASTLGLTNGDTVARWNPATRTYTSHIVGVPVNDFNIDQSTGYWINVPAGVRNLTLYGAIPMDPPGTLSKSITLPVGGGWAIIGFNSLKTTMKAANVPGMYVGGTVTTVARWNPASKTYTSWLSTIPTVNNFNLVPGQAYWILAGASGTLTYTP
jgi:hypothetical protein